MPAPAEIVALVEKFHEHVDAYKGGRYNETQVRREFVDPFFQALGWDVDNTAGYAEGYKDVVHEDAIKVGGSTKAPDYSFRIGGVRKYFVETKKPSVNVKGDPGPAYQLRRYAWSAKLPLSIVTDFEELAVYDCRVRPKQGDKPSKERTIYLQYTEYVQRWDEIAGIFSREAILKGSFDKYAASKKKRGTAEVDDEFLKEIERWRELLAKNVALRNKHLSQRELNFAVQKTIDRIIFLRICEDRGIEPLDQLRGVTSGKTIYPRLCQLFSQADAKYNSGLFHFEQEKDRREAPDEWTLELAVDDKVLKDIIGHLYYPDSPYEFSVLPADILGQIYERFLGKVIRLTNAHQAKVEEKPEVHRAGGVYYTPTYIVDYIVQSTVGKLIAGRTPHEIAARTATWKPSISGRPLSVLDPACGSGSFLIGAYQYLLDWYLKWYSENEPTKHCAGKEPRIYAAVGQPGSGAGFRLTTTEKKRILLDHIYGVDIDPAAVEVTKLSLLLKVLEGETSETLQRQLFAKQRALPDLAQNIKCGNSLIGPDFWQHQQQDPLNDEERLRINTFDWQAEFPHILASPSRNSTNGEGEDRSGFDAVIGNPPYIKEYTNRQVFQEVRQGKLRDYCLGKMDLWYLFACQSVDLLRDGGFHAFIATNNWVTSTGARILRHKFKSECRFENVVDFGPFMVFESASIQTMIYVARKRATSGAYPIDYMRVAKADTPTSSVRSALLGDRECPSIVRFEARLPVAMVDGPFTFVDERFDAVLKKMEAVGRFHLAEHEIAQGIVPNPDVVSSRGLAKLPATRVRQLGLKVGDPVFVVPRGFFAELPQHEADYLKPMFEPAELERYQIPESPDNHIIYLTSTNDPGNLHTLTNHLAQYREIMEDRRENRNGRISFNHLHWPRDESNFSNGQKILCVRKCKRPICVFTDREAYAMMAINVIRSSRVSLKALTAVLNSRLIYFWLEKRGKRQGDQLQVDKEPLMAMPLPFATDNIGASATVPQLEAQVDNMVALRSNLNPSRISHDRAALERQIAATDAEIDRLVYEVYDLSDDEIRLVEEATPIE